MDMKHLGIIRSYPDSLSKNTVKTYNVKTKLWITIFSLDFFYLLYDILVRDMIVKNWIDTALRKMS